jgi:hypothetical protein
LFSTKAFLPPLSKFPSPDSLLSFLSQVHGCSNQLGSTIR